MNKAAKIRGVKNTTKVSRVKVKEGVYFNTEGDELTVHIIDQELNLVFWSFLEDGCITFDTSKGKISHDLEGETSIKEFEERLGHEGFTFSHRRTW